MINVEKLIKQNSELMALLKIIHSFQLNDCWLCAGTIRNYIWDYLSTGNTFSNINLSDIQTKIRNNKLLIVFLLSAYIVRERCALCLCMINLYAHLSHLSLIRFSGSPELCIS